MRYLSVFDLTACFADLEPIQVTHRFGSFYNGCFDGILNTGTGRPSELNDFIDMVTHRLILSSDADGRAPYCFNLQLSSVFHAGEFCMLVPPPFPVNGVQRKYDA